MKHKKINAVEVCKEFEDVLALRLNLTATDRAVYYHLLRRTHWEGKLRVRFMVMAIGAQFGLTRHPVRNAVRRLANHGLLRIVERDYNGTLVEVRLPSEFRAVSPGRPGEDGKSTDASDLDGMDFLRTEPLRRSIHAREGNLCFYCLRRTYPRSRTLDHVVPRAQFGNNSHRNLVSCCANCNVRKQDLPAEDFLRQLFREGRLSEADLSARLQALRDLAAGHLRPQVFPAAPAAASASKKINRLKKPEVKEKNKRMHSENRRDTAFLCRPSPLQP